MQIKLIINTRSCHTHTQIVALCVVAVVPVVAIQVLIIVGSFKQR